MSHGETVERATQWLQDLINELPGLRNATSRDPGFKNWRQNAITILQRIWPADQNHAERFRRIPFSPVDPRADVRTQRESFSRGCQEAGRVLNSFIEEIHAHGVPDLPGGGALPTEESGLEDGFPTVDLPSGDLHGSVAASSAAELEQLPPQGADPSFLPPSRLHIDTPPEGTVLPKHHSTPPSDARQKRKGLGVAAKLRDLLGLTGFGEKPAPPPPPQNTGNTSALTQLPPRSLDIIPVGDDVETRPRSQAWPVPQQQPRTQAPGGPPAPPASSPQAPEPPNPATAKGSARPSEAGMSVVMSRPTTLRANIEKVSIESLISAEFRGGTDDNAASKAPAAATPNATPPAATPSATAASAPPPAAGRPPLSIVPPLSGDPEFNVDPAPTHASESAAEPSSAAAQKKIVPLPLPPVEEAAEESDPAADAEDDSPVHRADSAELSRATADFMRTSPVLGATGRKVQRAPHESSEHGFSDPDAIAIASMFDELASMGVPSSRQSEARARLLDLARRIETEDLPWNALRKAVWFAMEYPEVARRLIPMLLPWIDRAA